MKNKEINYFNLFIDSSKVCHRAAVTLESMLLDVSTVPEKANALHEIEREGDELYHTMYYHLNRSFITPIEREDILEIARYIEETIDTIDEVAIMFNMLSIQSIKPEAKEMVQLIIKSSSALVAATTEFKHFKRSKTLPDLLVELNHIEEDGDALYQKSIKNLFANEKNVLDVIKWKNIFDTMEDVLDACENVADIMERVIVKNS